MRIVVALGGNALQRRGEPMTVEASAYPFDVLGAQTEGMIGYLIEQEMGNLLPFEKPLATVLTMTEVDPDDPAFSAPTKFVGPVYTDAEAHRLAAERGWTVRKDGEAWRRVVPSPIPKRIFETGPVEWLLAVLALDQLPAILEGTSGTRVTVDVTGLEVRRPSAPATTGEPQ